MYYKIIWYKNTAPYLLKTDFYWKKHKYAAAPTAAPRIIVMTMRKNNGAFERWLEGTMTVGRLGALRFASLALGSFAVDFLG